MRPRRLSPLFTRLLLWFCVANLVTLAVSIVVTERIARRHLPQLPDWSVLAHEADAVYVERGPAALDVWIEQQRRRGLELALLEQGFNLSRLPLPPPVQFHVDELMHADNLVLPLRPELTLAAVRITGEDGETRQLLAAWRPQLPRPPVKEFLVLELLLTVLAVGLVGWWMARGIARPLAAVSAAARGMAGGELASRVPAHWAGQHDEFGQLARDFNAMAARIEALVARERSVLQDISHELRSPLARLRLNLELAGGDHSSDPRLAAADREVDRLDRLLGEVLSLARLEADLPGMTRERCDLVELARDCVAVLAGDPATAALQVQVQADAPLPVLGSPALLERAIENLLSNAAKYGAGTPVQLRLWRDGDRALLAVGDGGPGVPEADLPNLFRPFFRGANAPVAEGQGLGLAVVARIARAHGGEVEAGRAALGGLEVRLKLPLAAA